MASATAGDTRMRERWTAGPFRMSFGPSADGRRTIGAMADAGDSRDGTPSGADEAAAAIRGIPTTSRAVVRIDFQLCSIGFSFAPRAAYSKSSICRGLSAALTLPMALTMTPSSSIRYVVRTTPMVLRPYIFFSFHTS